MNKERAEVVEDCARDLTSQLLALGLDPAEAAVVLTTSLAFLYKVAFESNDTTAPLMAEHIRMNFIETTQQMQRMTVQ